MVSVIEIIPDQIKQGNTLTWKGERTRMQPFFFFHIESQAYDKLLEFISSDLLNPRLIKMVDLREKQ